MLTRIFVTTLMCCFALGGIAQTEIASPSPKAIKKAISQNSCINDRQYSPDELLQMAPFANAKEIKIVSYLKLSKGKKDNVMTGIIVNGKPDPTTFKEQVTLNSSQIIALAGILFNLGNKSLPVAPGCLFPNNSVIFYDSGGNILSVIDLSFGCESLQTYPSDLHIQPCSDKFSALRHFFDKAGIHYFGEFD